MAGVLGALCGLWCLIQNPAAAGELLRCKGPDGKIVYTDDKSVCPDAKPFEPNGRISKPELGKSAPPTRKPRARRRIAGNTATKAEAERWRAKKAATESELERVAEKRAQFKGFVATCNRRGRVIHYDDAGIKQEVACNELQQRFAELDAQDAKIRAYLEEGLAEDCRRAGCLPGWIR